KTSDRPRGERRGGAPARRWCPRVPRAARRQTTRRRPPCTRRFREGYGACPDRPEWLPRRERRAERARGGSSLERSSPIPPTTATRCAAALRRRDRAWGSERESAHNSPRRETPASAAA